MSTLTYKGYIAAEQKPLLDDEGKESILTKYLNERTGFVTDIARATVYDNPLVATRNGYIAGCTIVVEVDVAVTGISKLVAASTEVVEVEDIKQALGV